MTDTRVDKDPKSGLTYRWRPEDDPDAPSILLFHGLTGNEDVMWILESALPKGGFIAAPRVPFQLDGGSYSWTDGVEQESFSASDFESGVRQASSWIHSLLERHGISLASTVFVGFSQGAALSFLLAEDPDIRPAAVVALAGFLPGGELGSMEDFPVFWGHGTEDQTIPITQAEADIERLKELGAEVHYCQAEVGHKVGVECMRGLKEWLRDKLAG
ncbi:MAG: alpha/beta hydrolase [Anaerolineales bacterium]